MLQFSVNGNLKFLNSGKAKFLTCKFLRSILRSCVDANPEAVPHVERFVQRRFKHQRDCSTNSRNAENIVFLGPPGVGKTHLAIGLGIEAIDAGFKVYFANASNLVERLEAADKANRLDEKLRELSKFHLLIVDEMGYLPFNDYGAHCFFQLISRRYEKAAMIFTSNKPLGMGRYLQRSCDRFCYS